MKAGAKAKRQRLAVEAGQHDLAAGRQARDQAVEQRGVAADVVDRRGSRGACRRPGRRPRSPRRPSARAGLRLPHGRRRRTGEQRQPRQQPAEHAVADDQVRQCGAAVRRDRVVGRGGQRQQHALLAEMFVDRHCTRRPGTTSRLAAPPNRPRTSPKQLAPGTNTWSPTRCPEAGPAQDTAPPIRSPAPAGSPCPGNGGMRPVHSRRSVPVLMPLQSMSTTTSSSPGSVSGMRAEHETTRLFEHHRKRVATRAVCSSRIGRRADRVKLRPLKCQSRLTVGNVKQFFTAIRRTDCGPSAPRSAAVAQSATCADGVEARLPQHCRSAAPSAAGREPIASRYKPK